MRTSDLAAGEAAARAQEIGLPAPARSTAVWSSHAGYRSRLHWRAVCAGAAPRRGTWPVPPAAAASWYKCSGARAVPSGFDHAGGRLPAGEPLALKSKGGMAAAEQVERRGTHRQNAARREHARHLVRRQLLRTHRQVRQHIHGQHQVEGPGSEREFAGIALNRPLHTLAAGIVQAIGAQIHGNHGPAALGLQQMGKVPGAASGFQGQADGAPLHVRGQHTVHDGTNSPVPPEIPLALCDVGELRRVHADHAIRQPPDPRSLPRPAVGGARTSPGPRVAPRFSWCGLPPVPTSSLPTRTFHRRA